MSEQEQQQDSGKVLKAFNNNFRKLVSILNGDSLIKKRPKVQQEDFQVAMQELVKEEKEAKIVELKAEVKQLIKEKIDFDEFAATKKKELEKVIEEKQKEFNKKAESVFSKVQGIEALEARYYSTLQSAATNKETPDPELDPK